MEETLEAIRAKCIANFCDNESDIARLILPVEKSPYKYADGTIKTKPMIRDYAIALVEKERSKDTFEKQIEKQQKKIDKQQKQIEKQQKQIEKLEKQVAKLIHLFVDDEKEMED